MKTKLVLWGENAADEKVLIALQLLAQDNKVKIWTFPENIASEEFSQQLLTEWRNDNEVAFPEGFTLIEKELSITDTLLPDDLKVDRTDIISRAQTEWHFVVLSSKLNEVYQSELAELKEKVGQLTSYDSDTWQSLKTYWNKVQGQIRDRNLLREHVNTLRESTNGLFSRLKELRSTLDAEFQTLSDGVYKSFGDELGEIEKRISENTKLQSIFEELKNMQRRFRDSKLTREHRAKVWERLDAAFKAVKEKRFGPQDGQNSPVDRLQRRYNGLLNAIGKMEKSIHRDRSDFDFEKRRIANSEGQLEAQIREAKIKMIEERIKSKQEKLNEMMQTKIDLEKRLLTLKDKEAKRKDKEKVEEAKKAAKLKIAEDIKIAEEARKKESAKLEKAAQAIVDKSEKPEEKESLVDAVVTTVGDALEDVVDTIKAVAEVVQDKVETSVAEFTGSDRKEEKKEEVKTKEEPVTEKATATPSSSQTDDLKIIEGIGPKIEQILHSVGLKTYQQLAASSPDSIKAILKEAGNRFVKHDPTTWPDQSKMAGAGEWAKLKAWQDELDGGRIVKEKASKEEE